MVAIIQVPQKFLFPNSLHEARIITLTPKTPQKIENHNPKSSINIVATILNSILANWISKHFAKQHLANMIHKKDHVSWPNAVPPRTQVSGNIWISISVSHHTANVRRKAQPLRLPSSSLSTFSPLLPCSSSSHSSLSSLAGTPSRFQVFQYSIAYSHAVHQLSRTHSPRIIGTLNSLIDISSFPQTPSPWKPPFYPLLLSLTILDSTCEIMQCLSFCVCLISLSVLSSRFIHVAANGSISLFKKMAESVYHIFFIHLFVGGHLVCFHILDTLRKGWSLNGPTHRSGSLTGGGWETVSGRLAYWWHSVCERRRDRAAACVHAGYWLTRASDQGDRGETHILPAKLRTLKQECPTGGRNAFS